MIPRSPRGLGLDVEAERGEIQHIDKGIDRAYCIVLVDIVLDAVRQEGGLASIQPFDEALHESPQGGSLSPRHRATNGQHRPDAGVTDGSRLPRDGNLANLPAETVLRKLAAVVKARWICEQAHQQLKEELGLDHFEGRSWQGLHRHALMTMIAYAFLQHRRLAQAGRKKKNQRSTASAEPTGRTPSHRRSHRSTTTSAMPALQKMDLQRKAA